ncbi:MAG: hypothetical protein OEW60_02310 [Thiovulaceae bacterium]|nr:hypothetical protein [Sulfurimonadaceae bacterium]
MTNTLDLFRMFEWYELLLIFGGITLALKYLGRYMRIDDEDEENPPKKRKLKESLNYIARADINSNIVGFFTLLIVIFIVLLVLWIL